MLLFILQANLQSGPKELGSQGGFSLANYMHTQNTDFYISDDEKVEAGTVHLDVISCWVKVLS